LFNNDYSLFSRQITLDINASAQPDNGIPGTPSENLIRQIINLHYSDREKMEERYERYSAIKESIPIFNRENKYKKNVFNMIAHNYIKKITDTKVGYYASKTSYQYDDRDDSTDETDENEIIQDFLIRSSFYKLDSLIAKFMSICGYGVKALYLNGKDLKSKSLIPFECIFISESDEPQYCLRYFPIIEIGEKGIQFTKTKVEFYDLKYIHRFVFGTAGFGNVTENSFIYEGSELHLLGGLPLVQFKNNEEICPDCDDTVLSLIDAVDVLVSNGTDETGELANAYLVLVNLTLGNTAEERENKKAEFVKSGVVEVSENGDLRYVTKNLPVEFFNMLLKHFDESIFKFSNSIDYNNPEIGALSGIALKNKMLGLETNAQISENEFKCSTLEMFRVACEYWKLSGIQINYLDINIKMSRNYPLDLESEMRVLTMAGGRISNKTALSLMSFIPDAQKELDAIDEEENINLDTINIDNNQNLDAYGNPIEDQMKNTSTVNKNTNVYSGTGNPKGGNE
jgi:SPP1 family phage portal protein